MEPSNLIDIETLANEACFHTNYQVSISFNYRLNPMHKTNSTIYVLNFQELKSNN